MGDGSFAKEDVVRVMVNALLRFNNADMRVEMYHFCASLLRAAQQNALSFAFTQNDVDLFVTAYKQACSYSVRADEYYALLQVITDSPQPSSVPTVKEIKNPLFLQLALRLLASCASIFGRHLLLQHLVEMSGNDKKKENMKSMKYDRFFTDLLSLVPRMEDDNGAPAKKKELHARIRQCIDTLLQTTSQEPTEKAEAAFAVLRDADCEEAFAALVQVFKAPNAAQWCRERAVDLMYESARGRYNGVLNSIRLMLLEDVMRLYSRFSMSSIAVGVASLSHSQTISQCLRSTALPYSSDQILLLLYKLSLADLFQMKSLARIKTANLNTFVLVFATQFWTTRSTALSS